MQVKKRSGIVVNFSEEKIQKAVEKALVSEIKDEKEIRNISTEIANRISTNFKGLKQNGNTIIDVEKVQDMVEYELMGRGLYDIAKKYILYRESHKQSRNLRLRPDADVIHNYMTIGRYSRYSPELQRRESFSEAVDRVRDMHIRKYPNIETEITWAFDQVKKRVCLPSMRSMQFGGVAIEKVNARLYNCTFSVCDRVSFFSECLYLLLCGCGVGFSVEFEYVDKLPKLNNEIDESTVKHITIDDSIEGWADALKELITSYIHGYLVEFNYSEIRPKGKILKTSGGRAPGHVPLRKALERCRVVLDNALGRQLKPIECYDIVMYIADAVISGGVRRSATICLFSPDDGEMMNAKTGTWYNENPQRARSNNSVKLIRSEVNKAQFLRIFNRQKEWGEPGFYFAEDIKHGTNPCFSKSTLLHTSNGIENIYDMSLNDKETLVCVDTRVSKNDTLDITKGVKVLPSTKVVKTRENVDMYKVSLDTGNEMVTTYDHIYITGNGRKQLNELVYGDVIPIMSGKGCFGTNGSYAEGFMLGMLTGDGTISTSHNRKVAFVDYWYKNEPDNTILDNVRTIINKLISPIKEFEYSWCKQSTSENINKLRIGGHILYKYLESIEMDNKYNITDRIFKGTEDMVRGYIQGLFYTDGSVQLSGELKKQTLSVRLTQCNLELLRNVQILLNNFGIVSKIYQRRNKGWYPLPDGNGGLKNYECNTVYELIVNRPNAIIMENEHLLFGKQHIDLINKLNIRGRDCNKSIIHFGKVINIDYMGKEDAYCLTQPDTNSVIANGCVIGQCVEIGLSPFINIDGIERSGWQFCNLTEINGSMLKDEESFRLAIRAATIIGTCQAGYTSFPYLGKITEDICNREALLGVSITGMMDSPDIALNPTMQTKMAKYAIEVNKDIASKIGINSAARLTCVKPAGSTSLVLGTASGIHPRHARRYFRRIQANTTDPVYKYFKSINPHMCEPSVWSNNGTDDVITFCVESPETALVRKEVSALKLLEYVQSTQLYWVKEGTAKPELNPGLYHNVSNTITVCDEEWDEVAEYIWRNRNSFTGIALLHSTGDKIYKQAPHEEILTKDDELKWNSIIEKFTTVDFSEFKEFGDDTNLKGELACAGGSCEII